MESYTSYNIRTILFACAGSIFAGYGLAVVTTTIGQPTFYESMSLVADPTAPGYDHTSTILGAINGIFFAGGFLGSVLSGWAGERFGRLGGFRLASICGLVGGALQAGSVNVPMYLVSRFITGLASGQTLSAMPTYFAEVAPPHSRGAMTGSHGGFVAIGYSLAGWIGFGCFHAPKTTFSWRFPNAVLCLIAVVLLLGTFIIPESPRWLAQHGREEETLVVLKKLHHHVDDVNDEFARQELDLIKTRHEADAEQFASKGRWQLFTVPSYRKRFLIVFIMIAGGQNVGVLVVNNYSVALYQSLGQDNEISLMLAALFVTIGCIFNFGMAAVSDKIGRRNGIVWGYVTTVAVFIIVTALIASYTSHPTKSTAAAAVVFIYFYIVAYALFDVNQYTAAAEMFPTHLRSQACSLAISAIFLMDILWVELAPTAQLNIGWKYYLVFVCLGVAHSVHLFFFFPDTTGMALEQIDALFGMEDVHVPGNVEGPSIKMVV